MSKRVFQFIANNNKVLIRDTKQSRNDKCICGSGLKVKNCNCAKNKKATKYFVEK